MKTEKNLKKFIEQLKNTSPEIPADIVRSLIDSGKSSPFVARRSFQPRRVKQMFNPLKILIMTTFIFIVTSIVLMLNPFGRKTSDLRHETSDGRQKTERLEDRAGANPEHQMSKRSEVLTKPMDKLVSSSFQSHSVTPKITEKPILNILPPSAFQIDTTHDPDNTLWLNSKIFDCLGFSFDNGGFSLPFIEDNKWRTFSLGVKGKEGFSDFPDMKADSISLLRNVIVLSVQYRKNDKISFFQLSTIADLFSLDTALKGQSFNPMKPSADLFLPVRIIDTTLSEKVQNCLFWIYPNERFFSCLPPDIARQMRMEFAYQQKRMDPKFVPRMGGSIGIVGGQTAKEPYNMEVPVKAPTQVLKKDSLNENDEPVPCVYFTNLCESIPGLDYINLYPNPATDKLNIDLVLMKAKKIKFQVYDLGGRVISDEGSPENYPQGGQIKHQLDISKLMTGLYLLVVTDEEGARLTRRFIKN